MTDKKPSLQELDEQGAVGGTPPVTPEQTAFIKQWNAFTKDQQDVMRKMMAFNPQRTSTPATGGSFFGGGDQPLVIQDKPHLPSFSSTSKDASYGRWKMR